jgi:hypothetical protein
MEERCRFHRFYALAVIFEAGLAEIVAIFCFVPALVAVHRVLSRLGGAS